MDIDSEASKMVSGRPPQRSVSTLESPSTPPYIIMKKKAKTATQTIASQGFQKARIQLTTSSPSSAAVAINERHCSSKG